MSEIFLIIGEAKALCCNYTLEMSDFLRKEEVRYMVKLILNEFKSTDPSKLIDYVKNGIDIYQKLENDDYEQLTFYEAAVCSRRCWC